MSGHRTVYDSVNRPQLNHRNELSPGAPLHYMGQDPSSSPLTNGTTTSVCGAADRTKQRR